MEPMAGDETALHNSYLEAKNRAFVSWMAAILFVASTLPALFINTNLEFYP